MTIQTRAFTAKDAFAVALEGRAARRMLINSYTMKSAELVAGSAVLLSPVSLEKTILHQASYAVCEAWPSLELPADSKRVLFTLS